MLPLFKTGIGMNTGYAIKNWQHPRLYVSVFPSASSKVHWAMSKICDISGKKRNKSNKICFSNKKHRYFQEPNLQVKRIFDPETNRWVTLKVSTKTLKTITSYGLRSALKRYGITLEALKA
jgi:large subunit ribosomal protein L28